MSLIIGLLFNYIIGLPFFIVFFAIGLVMSATVVLLPFGTKFLKLSKLALTPAKYTVETNRSSYPWLNVIWDIPLGFVIGLVYFVLGLVLCATVIGIFVGRHLFKVAKFAFSPFGAKIDRDWYK